MLDLERQSEESLSQATADKGEACGGFPMFVGENGINMGIKLGLTLWTTNWTQLHVYC